MFQRSIRIMPSDVSCNGTIKLRSLLNHFQDTASLAVEDIEGKSTELLKRGYAWVVIKYEIDFTGELPGLDDDITIHTYHDPKHGYNTLRMFHVFLNGNEIITAKTSWLLADVKTGRPVKPMAHVPEITSRDNMDIDPSFREIPAVTTNIMSVKHRVKLHDTDINGHMNNAAYFEIVYDNMPADITAGKLKGIYASFRSGAKLDEMISADYSAEGEKILCRISRENSSRPCAEFMLCQEV